MVATSPLQANGEDVLGRAACPIFEFNVHRLTDVDGFQEFQTREDATYRYDGSLPMVSPQSSKLWIVTPDFEPTQSAR